MGIPVAMSCRTLLAALALAGAMLPANAQIAPSKDPTADALMMSAGFLSGHPDLRYRLLGLDELKQGNYESALKFFKRASFYGDKPSQGMVAELLWDSKGVPRDRPSAYAWIDLAAERGYLGFLSIRERYWAALDDAERKQALELGGDIYAQYGDAAAQPRLDAVLRRERRQVTGSRTGFAGNLKIYIPGPAGFEQIDGSKFYDLQFWDPQLYRQWQNSIWMQPRMGTVTVGEAEKVSGTPTASRVPATAPVSDAKEPETPQKDESGLGTKNPRP